MTPPDSGEREVRHSLWCQSMYADPVSSMPYSCNCAEPPPAISLPLPLAQRILAALEAAASDYERLKVYGATPCRALSAELRERLPNTDQQKG